MLTDKEIGKIIRKAYDRKLFGGELTMLAAIANNCNNYGECRKSNKDFEKQLNVSGRTISHWIASLKANGIIGVCINNHLHSRIVYIRDFKRDFTWSGKIEDLSTAQRIFREAFPNREIDCEIPDTVNIKLLINEIRLSRFWSHAQNLTLKSYIKKYDQIVHGKYRDDFMSTPTGSNFSTGRHYTREEINSYVQSIDEIEI